MSDGAVKTASKTPFHLLAGLGSGVLSAVLLQPIDLLKTRVQQAGHHSLRQVLADLRAAAAASSALPKAGAAGPAAGPGGSAATATATATAAAAAASASGGPPRSFVASLYRGTVPSALRTGLGSALYFAGLNAIRSSAAKMPVLGTTSSSSSSSASAASSSGLVKLSNTGNLLAGAVARAAAGFVLMPLTVLKVRYESSLYGYRSLAEASRDIARTEGLRGFFAGFGATALRDAPYAGLYVLLYEQIKRRLNGLAARGGGGGGGGGHHPSDPTAAMDSSRAAAINFSSGMLAAAACAAVSNPFDAVKTRIQLQPARYHNMVHATRRMLAEDGARALWDGLALRMSRKAMSAALAWTVYEELIRRAEKRWAAAATAGTAAADGVRPSGRVPS